MKTKLKTWVLRYAPAEVGGIAMAFAVAGIASLFTHNSIVLAYSASLGDNTGFYGVMLTRDVLRRRRLCKREHRPYRKADTVAVVRDLFLEFGGAELLDTLIVRPFCMYLFPIILQDAALGIVCGKVLSDVVFYGTVVVSVELKLYFSKE
jgi:hypothetical protein